MKTYSAEIENLRQLHPKFWERKAGTYGERYGQIPFAGFMSLLWGVPILIISLMNAPDDTKLFMILFSSPFVLLGVLLCTHYWWRKEARIKRSITNEKHQRVSAKLQKIGFTKHRGRYGTYRKYYLILVHEQYATLWWLDPLMPITQFSEGAEIAADIYQARSFKDGLIIDRLELATRKPTEKEKDLQRKCFWNHGLGRKCPPEICQHKNNKE